MVAESAEGPTGPENPEGSQESGTRWWDRPLDWLYRKLHYHRSQESGTRWWDRAMWFLLILLIVYFVGFACYHARVAVDSLAWQNTSHYLVGDSCTLLVEYPRQVPLEPPDKPGRPLMLRLWDDAQLPSTFTYTGTITCSTPLAVTSPFSYWVEIGPVGSGLAFTDKDGRVIPPSVPLKPALTASSASPATLYIRRAPSDDLMQFPTTSTLSIESYVADELGKRVVLPVTPPQPKPLIRPETEPESVSRHVLAIFFDPGPLQSMFVVLGVVLAGLKGLEGWRNSKRQQTIEDEERHRKWAMEDEKQRRGEEALRQEESERKRAKIQGMRDQIQALKSGTSHKVAFSSYVSIKSRITRDFSEDREALDELWLELERVIDPEWLPVLRKELVRCLNESANRAKKCLNKYKKEWTRTGSTDTVSKVRVYLKHLRSGDQFDPERSDAASEALKAVLAGFRAIGLEAAEETVTWLKGYFPDPRDAETTLKKGLFDSGVAGRYLLRKWGDEAESVMELLNGWQGDAWRPFYSEKGPCPLWPGKRGESRIVQQAWDDIGWKFNAFGPEKAEQDPDFLKQSLFHELPYVWEEVVAPKASIIKVGPGEGRTALIWRARDEFGKVKPPLDRYFPVFVPLSRFCAAEDVLETIVNRTVSAVCSAMVADPYNFLGLDEEAQYRMAEFLLTGTGGLDPLLGQLRRGGLSFDEPDDDLLQGALSKIAHSRQVWEKPAEQSLPHLCLSGTDHTFLFIDVSIREEVQIARLLDLIFVDWLPDLAGRHIVPKVFVSKVPEDTRIMPEEIKWRTADLLGLLRHRVERAKQTKLTDNMPALSDLEIKGDDHDEKLVEVAKGSPARLIALGNRLLITRGQKGTISAEDFERTLSTPYMSPGE